MTHIKKIALGTVQFGMPYGIANQTGQVTQQEIEQILDYAWMAGIDTLDTAIAYGDSEERLGKAGVGNWKIISKMPALPEGCKDIKGFVNQSIETSLAKLGVSALKGLLLHVPSQLLGANGEALYQSLSDLKHQCLIGKLGVSIYEPEELRLLLPQFKLDLVQAPFNIIDRRMMTSGWLEYLEKANIEVHCRSIFLQGLLLMQNSERPKKFKKWDSLWMSWEKWLNDNLLTNIEACLNYALSISGFERVLVGVDGFTHLKEICSSVCGGEVIPPPELISEDISLVNPSYWKFIKSLTTTI